MPFKIGTDSYSKCIIKFIDGNVFTGYSLDWKHSKSKTRDRELGLQRFRKLINKHSTRILEAVILDQASGQKLEQYGEGGTAENTIIQHKKI